MPLVEIRQKLRCEWSDFLTRIPLTPLSWGESAGSISVSLQMVTNGGDTEGLFRAAFMESGSPLATSDITAVDMYTAKIFGF